MKKILFPYDFSEASINAFRYALHLANNIESEILTIHAYKELSDYLDYHELILANYQVSNLNNFENYKDEVPKLRAIAEAENLGHIEIKHILQEGDAATAILNVAKSNEILFIVMGTTGASGIKETFLGSVTEHVMSRSNCPVLAIPYLANYRAARNMLFLSKLKNSDIPLVQQSRKIAKIMGAELSVLHIETRNDSASVKITEFASAFPDSDINFHVIESASETDAINDFIQNEAADIVVLPVSSKGFFVRLFHNSLSRRLLFHANLPLLSIRPSDEAR